MGYAVAAVVIADVAVICCCVLYLSRAGRTLDERWHRQREALETVRGTLEHLVGVAEERAREFEQILGARERHLRELLYRLAEQEERVRRAGDGAAPGPEGGPGLATEVRRLTAAGLGPVDIARELEIEPAQVRVILDLHDRGSRPERQASA